MTIEKNKENYVDPTCHKCSPSCVFGKASSTSSNCPMIISPETQKEAREAAGKGKAKAKANTLKHWKQLSECTEEELRKKAKSISNFGGLLSAEYCALCLRLKCEFPRNCPLNHDCKGECCVEWHEARCAYGSWYLNRSNFKTFQKRAKAMVKKIENS